MSEQEGLRTTIGKMVHAIENILGNGERAALRRISPSRPYTAALWKLLVHLDLDHLSDNEVESWALIAMLIAENSGGYEPNVRIGKALAEYGWSELRLTQLLEARDAQLYSLVRRLSHFMASKNIRADWSEIARIVLVQDGDNAEKFRKSIARHYFTQIYRAEKS